MGTRVLAARRGLAIEKITYEGTLLRGKAFSTPERIEKHVSVLDEDRPKRAGCRRDRKSASVLLRTIAAAMIEQDRRERSRCRKAPTGSL